MNIDKFTPSENNSFKDIESRVAALTGPERLLLKRLVMQKPTGSLRIEKPISFFASELCKDVRSIYASMKKLKAAGLVTRSSPNGMFAPCVTIIASWHVVDCILNPPDVLQVKKPSHPKKLQQPKPFTFLKDPTRFENVQIEMNQALSSASAYWDFIRRGFQSIDFNAPLTTEVQSRNLTTGRRSGTHKFRSRNVRLRNVELEMTNIAQYAQSHFLEVSFRVNSDTHPLILLDDLDESSLARLPDACAIVETSPNNFQATMIAPRPLSSAEFLLVEDALLARLGGGDHGAKGIRQLRRFPGSINNKPELSSAFVTRAVRISETATLSSSELNELIAAGNYIRGFYERDTEVEANQNVCSCSGSSIDNVITLPSTGPKSETITNDHSPSGRDFGKVIELIRNGWDDTSIIQQITISAGNRQKYGHPPGHPSHLSYAQGTVKSARARFKPDAPRMTPTWIRTTPHTALGNPTPAPQAMLEVRSK